MIAAAVGFVTTVIFGILANRCLDKNDSSPASYDPIINDQDCHLAGMGVAFIGSEDMAMGKQGVLLITSGDLLTTFTEGSAAASPGGMWVLDMREGGAAEPMRIRLELFPAGRRFQGHGLDVSNSTDRVYTVSHNGDHSSVDIFQIHYNQECLVSLPWSCPPLSLTFLRSIASSIFPSYGINDVVEAAENQIYVTQWQPFSFPMRGTHNPMTWTEKMNSWSSYLVHLMGPKMTQVFHCTWTKDSDATCVAASDQKFLGANGMTIDKDGDLLYVNDPEDKMITVMERDKETGMLNKVSEIILPFGADNIEYDDETNDIIIATIHDFNAVDEKFKGKDVYVAGGMAIAHKEDDWEVHDILNHDGSLLNQISAASRFGDKVVLGSPFSEGILFCKM